MKLDLKNIYTQLSIIVGLFAIFGVSTGTIISRTKDVMRLPEKVIALEAKIDSLTRGVNYVYINNNKIKNELDKMGHTDEMFFQAFRLMTDDDDKDRYEILFEDDGVDFDVDIRNTAEKVQLAFVFDVHRIYPVYVDHADGRYYIIVHNIKDDANQSVYLDKK